MQFDEFDKKVTEAANHHHPAYDEQAWGRMEKLLDRHLPQKKDGRRRFLFLILILIGLGGIGLFVARSSRNKNEIAVVDKNAPAKQTAQTETNGQNSPVVIESNNLKPGPIKPVNPQYESIVGSGSQTKNPLKRDDQRMLALIQTKKSTTKAPDRNAWWQGDIQNKNINDQARGTQTTAAKTGQENFAVTPNTPMATPLVNKAQVATVTASANDNPISTAKTSVTNPENNKKAGLQKKNFFSLTVSTGPDVSFVDQNKLGSARMMSGAGLGYTFNNRVTLRTGFYATRKVYTAAPGSYKPSPDFYAAYPYLEKVEADCKIYEVPLTVSYNLSRSSQHNFFATAGLSSYIMKKEEYDYSYRYTQNGSVYKHKQTVENGKTHFLSGITLSAGYRRSLGKRVSIMAEPYIKLPISGVGYGKVKLNSTGILLSVGIKPFR